LDRRNDKMGQNGLKNHLWGLEMVLWDHLVLKYQHNWFLQRSRDRITHQLLANLKLSTETTEQFTTY
jgi:hypothetical protein